MARRIEMRITGRGGQGILTIGKILAHAFGSEEKNVVLTKSYGPTARGGASQTELVVADRGEEVDFPQVISPNLLVALSQEAFNANIQDVDPLGVVIVDSSDMNVMRDSVCRSILGIPFSRLATQGLGDEMLVNVLVVLILGKICMISDGSLMSAIRKNLPQLGNEIIDRAIGLVGGLDENIRMVIETRAGEARMEGRVN